MEARDTHREWRRTLMLYALLALAGLAALRFGGTRPLANEAARLWQDPGPVAERDLFHGATSDERAPQPPFRFLKEDSSGSKPKLHVRDANGQTWSVKFDRRSGRGSEVPAEIAASRIAWALGYFVEESYLVRDGVITDTERLKRGRSVLDERGHFAIARFEPRPKDVERLDIRWTVADNPFTGSRELAGLVMLAALVNDWDFRAGNTTVLRVPHAGTQYLVSDWGTAFGRMSPHRSRWDLDDYRKDPQFFAVSGDAVEVNLNPDDSPERARVSLDHARWFASLAAQLTLDQLRRAFEAAGATAQERDGFAAAVHDRVARLHAAVSDGTGSRAR